MLVQTLPGAREKHGEKLIRFKFQHFRRAGITGGSGVNLQSQEALEATSCSTCDLCKNVNALGSKDAYTPATHAHSHTIRTILFRALAGLRHC